VNWKICTRSPSGSTERPAGKFKCDEPDTGQSPPQRDGSVFLDPNYAAPGRRSRPAVFGSAGTYDAVPKTRSR
jgi:hypothetical protein